MPAFKVVRLLDGEPEVLRARWERALATEPPLEGRPERVAWAVPLALPGLPPPRCAAIDVQWFADVDGALANEAWLASLDPDLQRAAACRVVAEEVVLRGQDDLAARWLAGGQRYKMMSFGRRNPALTRQELSERWRGEAGRLGGEEIPVRLRGLAYVQNHPVPLDGREWPFDAVNEVWFERIDDLRQRAAWFAAHPAPTSLWSEGSWSAYLREIPLPTR